MNIIQLHVRFLKKINTTLKLNANTLITLRSQELNKNKQRNQDKLTLCKINFKD